MLSDDNGAVVGKSILKSTRGLTTFQDLLDLSFKDPFSTFELNHFEKDWENIPFLIPQSVLTLEKRIMSLQLWGRSKEEELQQLRRTLDAVLASKEQNKMLKQVQNNDIELANKYIDSQKDIAKQTQNNDTEQTNKYIKSQNDIVSRITQLERFSEQFMKSVKSDMEFRAPVSSAETPLTLAEKSLTSIKGSILLDEVKESSKMVQEDKGATPQKSKLEDRAPELKDRDSFSKFFTKLGYLEEYESKNHLEFSDSLMQSKEFNSLRNINMKQLRYIIFQYLNRSLLRERLEKLDARSKDLEVEVGKLDNFKQLLFSYVDEQINKIEVTARGGTRKKSEDDNTLNQMIKAFESHKRKLTNITDSVEEIRAEMKENTAARNTVSTKCDKMVITIKNFSSHLENKFTRFDEETRKIVDQSSLKVDESLSSLTAEVRRISDLVQNSAEQNRTLIQDQFQQKAQELTFMFEKHRDSQEKAYNAFISITGVKLDDYSSQLATLLPALSAEYKELDKKIQTFIEQFESYSKTKIEPAFHNQAKIYLIESKITSQEAFSNSSYLFLKDILKKFLYAIQMHNSQMLQKSIQKEQECNVKSPLTRQKEKATNKDASDLNITTDFMNLSLNSKLNTSFWGGVLEPKIPPRSTSQHRTENIKVPDPISLTSNLHVKNEITKQSFRVRTTSQPRTENSNQKKEALVPAEETPIEASHSQENPSNIRSNSQSGEYTGLFDMTLHKRLEKLRAILIEDEKNLPITSKSKQQSKGYKDLDLVSFENKRRKHQLEKNMENNDKIDLGAVSQFSDIHMLNNSVL